MSLMGESGCNQVLSVDGCDQKQRLATVLDVSPVRGPLR